MRGKKGGKGGKKKGRKEGIFFKRCQRQRENLESRKKEVTHHIQGTSIKLATDFFSDDWRPKAVGQYI